MNSGSTDALQAQQQAQQLAISKGMGQINKAFAGFTPDFYQQRAQAYENYALPQLGQQERQTGQNLEESLADRGLSASGAGDTARSALAQDYALQQQGVANTGQQQAQQLQEQVQGQENTLVGELTSSNAPGQVAQQALSTAAGFQTPSLFAPIGQAFTDFGNTYLAQQTANTYMPYLSSLMAGNLYGLPGVGQTNTGGAVTSATNQQ